MTLKKVHLLVAVVGIGLAGASAWWYQNQGRPAAGTTTEGPTTAAPARSPGGPAGGGPAAVEVARASAMRLDDDAQAVGSVLAVQSVTLRPEVSGRIRSLGFVDGQRVRRGQLLLQLDDTLQQAQFQQAQAQAAIARTNLQRSRELAGQNFVSQSAVDQNAAALEVAQAQVALAQAQLSRMRVSAPFAATAGIRSVNVGDYVKDGADVVTLDDTSSVYVDFRLPERYAARVRKGHPIEAVVDALPGSAFTGTVVALDSAIDSDGRALLVRSQVANPAGVLRTGMFARVRVVFSSRSDALMVPEEALVPQGGKQYVFKVVPGPGGGMVSRKLEARVGLRTQGKAEIMQGLAPGDTVVTAGHARLLRGDSVPVRIVDLSRPAGGAPAKPGASASGAGGVPATPAAASSGSRGALPA